MKKILIYLAFVAITGLALTTSCSQKPDVVADAIYVNGVVITVNPDQPNAQAFAVKDGLFLAVGKNRQIRRYAGPNTAVVDLQGRTVTPGFNDAHVHIHATYPEDSPFWIPWLGPEEVRTMDELIAVMKRKAAQVPAGELVHGQRYQDDWLGGHPTRWDLDKISTVHPVSVRHSSGHVSVVNSYILEKSGITKNTPDPTGQFGRDENGELNGRVYAGGMSRLTIPRNSAGSPSEEEQRNAYLNNFRTHAQNGLTSIGIAGPSSLSRLLALRDSALVIRIAVMPPSGSFSRIREQGINFGDGDEHIRISAMKLFHGNSFSGNTCWVTDAYVGRPDFFGIPPTRSQESLDSIIQLFHDAGFQVATHSNGDREIDMTITAIERAQANNPKDLRHRIEHASVMTMPLLERAKAAGIILVFHSYLYEHGEKLESFSDRMEMVHPYRMAIDMGARVAGHSDYPIAPALPIVRIHSMVNRLSREGREMGLSQRTTVEEAIKVWTLDGAFTTFEEDIKGSITPGKLADFVILTQDPRKAPVEEIKNIEVYATFVGGVNVWQAP